MIQKVERPQALAHLTPGRLDALLVLNSLTTQGGDR